MKSFGLIVLHVGELPGGTLKIRFPGCTSRSSDICFFFFFFPSSPGDFDLQCDLGPLYFSHVFFIFPKGPCAEVVLNNMTVDTLSTEK